MISIEDISFSYGDSMVLSNISLDICAGERWGIIGKNGAGKSTLIKLLSGLIKVKNGSITILNQKIGSISPANLARYIAYVPQGREQSIPFSVYDYVMMGRFPYQGVFAIASNADKEIVENALQLTDCLELKDRLMTGLSGGEQQRVLLAGAVSQQTQILILDEPTTFLDPLHQIQLEKALTRVHKETGLTVLTVTHDLNAAVNFYDHILALVNGKVFYAGLTTEFISKSPDILSTIFGIKFQQGSFASGSVFVSPTI